MLLTRTISLRAFVLLLLSLASGCATQLAPQYDAALFKGVTDLNVELMSLFASVSAGTDSASCNERLPTYNALIGKAEALALQSEARPVPENSITERVNAHLDSRGIAPLDDGVAPSAHALRQVAKQVSKMRDVDCRAGLSPGLVAPFKNAVVISMDQAITYESFLNR